MVQTMMLPPPPVSVREVLRYGGVKTADDTMTALIEQCITEALPQCQYKVCYSRLPVSVDGDAVTLGNVSVCSSKLSKTLRGCHEAVVFAATVGIGIDRLIAKYQTISPSKAVVMQALGAERIESLCDAFCRQLETPQSPRFSPGYGDLPLDFQRELFAILDCPRKIGVSLTEGLLMSPSKSVTAIVGIGGETCQQHGCAYCENTTCEFRRSV